MTNKEVNKLMGTLKVAWKLRSDPTFPVHAIAGPKYNCDKANDLTNAIIDWFTYSDHYARRLSSEGRYRPGTRYQKPNGVHVGPGQWLPGLNKGMADVMATMNGNTLWIEVKVGNDRLSAGQKKFAEEIIKSGGIYQVIRDFETFLVFVKQYNRSSQK